MPIDDLLRNVYCVLGIPIDVVEMPFVLRTIHTAAASKTRFLISTPNLNFLVNSLSDPEFKQSIFQSDLCPADGMPVVWIARLFGIPVEQRVAGSDIFEALKVEHEEAKPLKVFMFGADESVAAEACQAINARPSGLRCVGSLYPGLGSAEQMSSDDVIEKINSSNADFLVVSLGAKKGQKWLLLNHDRLLIPIRSHLGAVINFQADVVGRAPFIVRKLGFEWLWRIKEEPHLWRRYWNDGSVLAGLMFTHILPLVLRMWWLRMKCDLYAQGLVITQTHSDESVTIFLSGPAITRNIDKIISAFKKAINTRKRIIIDFSNTCAVDARFLGLLLMLQKKLKTTGTALVCIGLLPNLKRIFNLNNLQFLLDRDIGT